MRLQESRKDYYRRLAKERGYKSRAAFKLIEANQKYGLIEGGDRVVDFGAAPGGWLQVSSDLVGEFGVVIGVDLEHISFKNPNVRTLRMDVYSEEIVSSLSLLLGGAADVVLSDLSPSISGAWELDHFKQVEQTLRVISLAKQILRRGGNSFLKTFDGERFTELRDGVRKSFQSVTVLKPAASRKKSSELFLVCKGWRHEPALRIKHLA